MQRSFLLYLAAALSLGTLATNATAADYVIVVNKDNANPVDKDFAAKAYRGEAKSWPGGGNVTTVALPEENASRVAFDKDVLGKSPAQSRALWAQMTFSGKAVPPKMVDSEADVVKAVAENKNAIGYVSPGAATAGVKVIK
jgi:ABC-type phosphate transport system substrate-binding protein